MEEYPIIRRIMKMTAGSISIPFKVKRNFTSRENEAISDVWFRLLEDELLCQYILCPILMPKVLEKSLCPLTKNAEIQNLVKITSFYYLEYSIKQYSQISPLRNFYLLELNKYQGKDASKDQIQKVHNDIIYWLEANLQRDIMLEHTDEISDLFKILIFTRSDIMKNPNFYELFFEKRLDIVALIQ